MSLVHKTVGALVFGFLAMAVTGTVKPVSVGLVQEARADGASCDKRCWEKHTQKTSACTRKHGKAWQECIHDANVDKDNCRKDCAANAK